MKEKEQLGIVADQIGTPTWAKTLAEACWKAVELKTNTQAEDQVFHWTDAGTSSWYDFAVAIQEEALALGLLEKDIPVKPIPASAYPTPARRPPFSVLDKQSSYEKLEMPIRHWCDCLKDMLAELNQYAAV